MVNFSFHTNSHQGLGSYQTAEISHTGTTVARGHRHQLLAVTDTLSQHDMFGEGREGM